MNAADTVAVIARTREILREDERRQRKVNEERLDKLLRDYITDGDVGAKHYEYGGVYNLLTTIAAILDDLPCERFGLLEADYEKAVEAIRECAEECNLKYREA